MKQKTSKKMSRRTKFQAQKISDEQKLVIALDYVNSEMTLNETAEKYGQSPKTLWNWVHKFGLKEKMLSLQDEKETSVMAKKQTEEPLTEQEARDRIRELEMELGIAKMQVRALNTLIDIAEEQGYPIRKKSGAKQ